MSYTYSNEEGIHRQKAAHEQSLWRGEALGSSLPIAGSPMTMSSLLEDLLMIKERLHSLDAELSHRLVILRGISATKPLIYEAAENPADTSLSTALRDIQNQITILEEQLRTF